MRDVVFLMGIFDKLRSKDKTAPAAAPGTVKDPVCGMMVQPAKAAGTSTHGRETYHFCSAGCKAKFDADPHRFLGHHAH